MLHLIPVYHRTQALLSLDSKSLGKVFQSYAQTKQLNRGKEIHAHLLRLTYPLSTSTTNHLIVTYFKCGALRYARYLFDKMPHRNLVSWTAMITAFSQNSMLSEAVRAFSLMRIAGLSPTQFAFASLVRACVSLGPTGAGVGKQMHCLALKSGFGWDVYVATNLSDMYSKSGAITDACRLFEEIEFKDAVLWTAMIDGYAKNRDLGSALMAFKRMNGDGIRIDPYVLSTVFSACASVRTLEFGKCLHSVVVKLGFELEVVVSNTLIDMYSRSGDTECASNVFEIFSDR